MELLSDWRLLPDPENRGVEAGWPAAMPPEAEPAPVPGVIQQVFPSHAGVAWYWTTFEPVGPLPPETRYLFRFGAVDYLAEVWLNGQPVGGHEGGETPFELDVTSAVNVDSNNLLAVRVINPADEPIDGLILAQTPHRNKTLTQFRPGTMLNSGGIVMPVVRGTVPAVRLADMFVQPSLAEGLIRLAATVHNDTDRDLPAGLEVRVAPATGGEQVAAHRTDLVCSPGLTTHHVALTVSNARRWDLDDPFLYQVGATLTAAVPSGPLTHTQAVRCGFRDFRVERGYFRLNGRRIFMRSTHTGNHYPIGQVVPTTPDFVRRDLINAKAAGFNMVRFIAGMPLPEQLDFCDELGLLVYEECLAGWMLGDSPHMADRFDRSVREMVLRDRNHPSVVIWGLLNETRNGPVFRHAVGVLPWLRELDPTRLVLLSSGRWDARPGIGSVCNPGNGTWEHTWGIEAPGAPAVSEAWDPSRPAYIDGAGDLHVYPAVPHTLEFHAFVRTLGQDTRPVLVSEYGVGSLFNAIGELRRFEQFGARPDLRDAAYIASMAEKLNADWQRYAMGGVYAFPEDMFIESYRLHARQRALGFDLIRSNPKICGFNVTGMLDHALTGEGLWTFWRDWKPGIADTLADGWAPLRWCLFSDPHVYRSRPFKVEAVLANEDVLEPGRYPARLRISGLPGIVWEQAAPILIPAALAGEDSPLAVPVLKAEASVSTEPGVYQLAAEMEHGGRPAGGRLRLFVSDPTRAPQATHPVSALDLPEPAFRWLRGRGHTLQVLSDQSAGQREVIVVGDEAGSLANAAAWQDLARRVARGGVAVFLSPAIFQRGAEPLGWLPLATKGRCEPFHDWLYHKECVSKAHMIFAGLPGPGVMDWDYYGQVIPHQMFEGQEDCPDVAAVAFAVGYNCPGGYASGILAGSYPLGAGRFVLNTFSILPHLDRHPAADCLLLNLIHYAASLAEGPLAVLPADFDAILAGLGYG